MVNTGEHGNGTLGSVTEMNLFIRQEDRVSYSQCVEFIFKLGQDKYFMVQNRGLRIKTF
jgi:hypothetical protein